MSKISRNADCHEMSRLRKQAGLTYSAGKLNPDMVAARLAEIPPDDRSLTGRLMGDPLRGRSALSKATTKGGEQ